MALCETTSRSMKEVSTVAPVAMAFVTMLIGIRRV